MDEAPSPNPALLTGAYLKGTPPPTHQCPLPAQWTPGTIWRCWNGHLWTIRPTCWCQDRDITRHPGAHTMGYSWYPAPWWTRTYYNLTGHSTKRAHFSMANHNRQDIGIRPSPPRGRGPVSTHDIDD
jgi:hypothetical protein